MNASRPLFPIPAAAGSRLLIAAGCLMLSACAGNPFKDSPVDPRSPVAAQVNTISRQHGKFPTFASIPEAPKDVRPLAQYGRSANATEKAGEQLTAATAPGTWTLNNSEAFAQTARKDAGPQLEAPKPGDADAFAKAQRERATPPPPR